jgi:hypothetical protein
MPDETVSPPPVPPIPPVTPAVLQVHAADWQAAQAKITELEQYRAKIETDRTTAERSRLEEAAKSSNMAEELRKLQEANQLRYSEMEARYNKLETETLAAEHGAVLSAVLNGVELIGDDADERAELAAMIRRDLSGDIEAVRDSAGRVVVREKKTYKPAIEYLREQLASRRFHRFIRASAKPGSGSGPNLIRTPPGTTPDEPGSLNAIVADWQRRQQAFQSFGLRGNHVAK